MTAWRTARVFISSTFRDMHAERDLLVNPQTLATLNCGWWSTDPVALAGVHPYVLVAPSLPRPDGNGRRIPYVLELATGAELARFPAELELIRAHPDGRTWAAAEGSHLHLLRLEGA